MTSYWPTEDGWPYADTGLEEEAMGAEPDVDLLAVKIPPPHLYEDLEPLERQVITSRFGLAGAPVRTMKQLHADLGVPRADLRSALGSGLAKLRDHLA